MINSNIVKLAFSVLVCELVALLGSLVTMPSIEGWYATIQKPFFNPPSWIFAPVWTVLFLLMGISLYLIVRERLLSRESRVAVLFFGVQLGLNLLWPVLFFGLHSPFFAFIEILALWLFIFITAYNFWKISRLSAYLLVPYLVWVAFAAVLNFSIWILNL